ncbi:MAG: hypothetical protein ACWA40_10420 [Planktomarina sp.]
MAEIHKLHEHLSKAGVSKPLKKGGGDGTFNGMENRIRKLETDVAYIKGKLEDMPTKDWMTVRLIAIVGGFAAITAFVQYLLTT